jgi:hypothetical protein
MEISSSAIVARIGSEWMSERHGKKPRGRGRDDDDPEPVDDEAVEGKPLPPPPPLRKPAPSAVASSPIPTIVDPPGPTEVGGPVLESDKPTIVGMPLPAPDASAEARESPDSPAASAKSPIVGMDDIAMSDPEIPLTPGAMNRGLFLLARRKREAILGSAALLGVLTGFYLVLSLASPRPHATDAAASVAAQPQPPVATAPEELPPPPTTAPSGETAAASPPPVSPISQEPAASAPVISARPPAKPAPSASHGGPCNPPYRLDFFGKKVQKPGCS